VQIERLVWRRKTVEKIQRKHRVTREEVEEIFWGQPYFRRSGEVAYAFGQTRAGRYLFVVFKSVGQSYAEILTAREMDETEKHYYKKRRKPR